MKIQQIGLIKINSKKVLANVKINNFNHKNKIGKLKFNDIYDFINNIKNKIQLVKHLLNKN